MAADLMCGYCGYVTREQDCPQCGTGLWRADTTAPVTDPRDAEALAMGFGDLRTWLGCADTPTTERPVGPQPDTVLLQLTAAARSAFAAGLPVIATACEDAATEIILLRGRVQRAILDD